MSERDIFNAAREITDPAARSAYLDGACGADAELRARVEALLRAHDQPDSLLDHPVVAAPDPDPGATEVLNGTPDPGVPAAQTTGGNNDASDDEPLTFLSPSTRPDSLGRIGHYEVLQILGRGGFGIVFRAFDEVLQRVVSLKVMAPQLAATSPARKRFLREARSSAQVRHENVVQVYEVAEQPLPYLAMEFIPGETLQQRLDRVGPLDVPETLRIGRQIAEGLAAAHAMDLIHRDIKPGNVLLEGGQHKVKITDFGLARSADDASISQSGIIAGTPMYMAPEQALGQTLDQRADLFSLGSLLYQMVAGRPPFRANTTVAVLKRVAEDKPRAIREIIPETPQWLCEIIAKLHAKDPADRYQSAREVADVLADCEAQLKANAKLKDFSRIPRNKQLAAGNSGRWKWAAAAALLLPVLALALTEITGMTHLLRDREPTPIIQGEPTKKDDPSIVPVTDRDGWVQLFNGKDLDGWMTPAPGMGKGVWQVDQGLGQLVGRGPASYLFTQRGDFADFHLRAEVSTNADPDCGIFFRSGQVLPHGKFPAGYVATLGNGQRDGPGTLLMTVAGNDYAISAVRVAPVSVPVATFFTVDVIARGKHLLVKINDKQVAEYSDEKATYMKGRIALQAYTPNTVVRFRKIEIKELPLETKPASPAIAPFTDADVQRIAALPAEQQVEEVRKELKRRNPGFDGKMETKIEGGVVTKFRMVTDQVTDIAPIRVFDALRVLDCHGSSWRSGQLADLTPLEGINFASLTNLDLGNTNVTDAAVVYFKDLKELTDLNLAGTKVSDVGLAQLKDCKNLKFLYVVRTPIDDAGLAQLKGMPLKALAINDTGITDLAPLQGMPLEAIWLTPKNITRGLDILRDMKSLKTIGIDAWDQSWPAAEFWERYGKGEFK